MRSDRSLKSRLAYVVASCALVGVATQPAFAFKAIRMALLSLDTSARSVVAGDPMTGQVRLDQPTVAAGAIVSLRSSNPVVATVQTSLVIGPFQDRASFGITARAAGCTEIIATHSASSTSRKRQIVVHPWHANVPFTLTVPDAALLLGAAPTSGSISGVAPTLGSASVSLTSSNPSVVAVPATRSLVRGSATFSLTPVGQGCAKVTARVGTLVVSKMVQVIHIGG